MLTAGDPFMRKWEDAPESDSAYFTRWRSRLVLNIIDALADCFSLLSVTLFFHLAAILLVEIPPHGKTCCGMKMPAGMSDSAAPALFSTSMSVLHCVVAVSSSEGLLAQSE